MGKEKFKSTKERLVKRCLSWAEKNMSCAKEILIKFVPQAIPTYTMGVFKLPASTCDELTQLIRRFWWGKRMDKGKSTGLHGRNVDSKGQSRHGL
jgi:hypothetical protein